MLHAGEDIANQRVALFIACLGVHDVLVCLFEGTRRAQYGFRVCGSSVLKN